MYVVMECSQEIGSRHRVRVREQVHRCVDPRANEMERQTYPKPGN